MPPDAFFSGLGLDRADPLRSKPALLEELAASPNARQLAWRDGAPEIGEDGALCWAQVTEPALFLGFDGDVPCFCGLAQVADGFAPLSQIANLADGDAPLFAAALSLARWHSRHRFCANCGGGATDIVRGGWSRRCPACSAEHFPRVDPVVIMLAEHDGRLLLGRQPHYPPNRYSALAGFVEVGETIEASVAREIREEAGVHVADVTYVTSQPWPFPSSLMVGCMARALGDELVIDRSELDDARWFTRDEVAAAVGGRNDAPFGAPPRHTIARTLLEHWLAA